MLENATNLTNTTVRTSEGFLGFLSDYWQELSALAALITIISVVIGLVSKGYFQKRQHAHDEEMEKSRHEYDKKLRQQAKDAVRAMKMLRHFINPLIKDLELKTHGIDDALDTTQFGAMQPRIYPLPNYKFAFTNIFGSENCEWLKGKVNEYNNSVNMLNDTISKFSPVIEESIKKTFPEKIEIFEKDMNFFVYHIANNDRTLAGNPEDPYGFWNKHVEEILAIRDSGKTLDKANEIKQHLRNAKKVASELKARLEKIKEQCKKRHDIDDDEIEVKEGEVEVRS